MAAGRNALVGAFGAVFPGISAHGGGRSTAAAVLDADGRRQ